MFYQNKRVFMLAAFSLAEVLITLGIIGVVAAMTIPTLMNNIANAQYKTAYKKAYSTLSQAWSMAATNGDTTPCTNLSDVSGGSCNADNFTAIKKYFKVTKDCGSNTAECWNMSGEKTWGGNNPQNDALAFIDASGFAWSKNESKPAMEVAVDVNGFNKPNKYGQDRFIFDTYYYTFDTQSVEGNLLTIHANNPKVIYFLDLPYSDTASFPKAEQQYRCPSMITDSNYHCYYSSWITGGQ